MKVFFRLLFFLVIIFQSCNKDSFVIKSKEFEPIVLSDNQKQIVSGGNAFAMGLFSKFCEEESGSFMISPLSVQYLLGLLATGAAGETRSEILKTVGFDGLDINTLNEFHKHLYAELMAADNSVEILSANLIIYNQELIAGLKTDYIEDVQNYYEAYMGGFVFSKTDMVKKINDYVSQRTKGMITELLKGVSPDSGLLALNTIYFNGRWNSRLEFSKNKTVLGLFTKDDGSQIEAKYMNCESEVYYCESAGYQAVRLPYGNGAFAMDIYLPKSGNNLSVVTSDRQLKTPKVATTVDITLPLFEIETRLEDMSKSLSGLGIVSAFGGGADFSNMLDCDACFNRVLHQTKITVTQTGTISAAATLALMDGTVEDGEVAVFEATHPFLFIISETSTKTILFIGAFVG